MQPDALAAPAADRSAARPSATRNGIWRVFGNPRLWALAVAVLAVAAAIAWTITAPKPRFRPEGADALEGGDAERGRLVFAAGDCASCHASPGQGDRLRLGGGLALASPFGTFRPPNISPHPTDGIGRWRTVDLANALMAGVSPGGQHYYPALPYPSYARMDVGDVRDLMAYLRTLPAVAGRPPDHDVPMLFRIRRAIGLWKALFLDESPIRPDPAQSEAWNRGRYLVEAVGHCAECHSGRNLAYAIKESQRFAGGPNPEGVGFAPNITPAGIGAYSEDDLVRLLTTGQTPEFRYVGATMADVVANTAALPETDRRAIAVYVKSLPPRPTSPP